VPGAVAALALTAVLGCAVGCAGRSLAGESGLQPPEIAPPALIARGAPSGAGHVAVAIASGEGRPMRWTRAGAWRRESVRGIAARVQVTRPVVAGDEHSLVEVEAQLGPRAARHAVELGIRTSPVEYRDGEPHLFVFAWVAGRRTCYDGCGWRGAGASVRPGEALGGRIGTEVTLGLVLHQGAWWAWMDSEWLGAFPLDVWEGAFSEAEGLQWFGEVYAPGGQPRSEMGNGLGATSPGAATIRGLCHVPWDRWTCVEEERVELLADAPSRYSAALWPDGTLSYGGPGDPPALTPRPPPSSASGGTPSARGR